MQSEEALAAENAVEAKLAEAGADAIRRYSFSDAPEAAPEQGTPAEEVSAEQPRNELGQFSSTEPASEAGVEDQQVEEVPSGQDPAVAAFLNKYGGDVEKALAGAVHLQRKAGEQSNELGDLRRMVDELSQLRETVQADYQQRQQNIPLDQGTIDWFDQQAYENPYGMAEYARQQNNNVLFQRAMGIMKETQPADYAVYVNNLNNQQLRAEMEQKLQAASQLPADSAMHMALQNVRANHPEYVNYDDALEATFERHPFVAKALEQAVASGDRQQIEGAIETAYGLAVGDTLTRLTLAGQAPETTTASAEVAEPTTSETREPEPEPSRTDQFLAAFRQEAEHQRARRWVAE